MFITIHQPEFMPWAGYIDKIMQTEHFVVLDSVKYQKNYFLNRCRIKHDGEAHWLTVPVKKQTSQTLICDRKISRNADWAKKGLSMLSESYRDAPYWQDHEAFFADVFDADRDDDLAEMNIAILKYICDYLSIPFHYTRSSDMSLQDTGSDLVLEICRKMAASHYLSGTFGADYLNGAEFEKAKITVVYQDYTPPVYSQFDGTYCGPLSVIDMLLNHGPDCAKIIESGRQN